MYKSLITQSPPEVKVLTPEEQRLAEVAAEVLLTHSLHSEQVQEVRGHVGYHRLLLGGGGRQTIFIPL